MAGVNTHRALVVALALGISEAAGAQTVGPDSAEGTGTAADGSIFSFSATSGPAGENATGSMTLQEGTLVVKAVVQCLQVTDNRASISGVIIASNAPPGSNTSVGNTMIIVAEDNGNPGAGQDRYIAHFGAGDPATACQTSFPGGEPIQAGEIVVLDTTTQPPPNEECDDDDDNQGDDDRYRSSRD